MILGIKDIIGFLITIGIFVIGWFINRKTRRIQSLMIFKEFREPLLKFANEAVDIMSEVEGLCEIDPETSKQDFFNKYNQLINKLSSFRDKGKFIIPNSFPERYGQGKSKAYQGFRHSVLDCLTAAYYITISINYEFQGYNKEPVKFDSLDINIDDRKSKEYRLSVQRNKLKAALDKLPDKYSIDGYKGNGWSAKKAIVEIKRQFVTKIQDLVQTRTWEIELKDLSKKNN